MCTLTNPWGYEAKDGRLFCMFISIKNRDFTRDYIQWFVNACDEGGYQGLIASVDEPYIYNRMAELGTDSLPDHESARIYQVSKETTRKAEKVIRGARSNNVTLTNWAALSSLTPAWMKEEVITAYQQQGAFWLYIREFVAEIKNHQCDAGLDRYVQFFLCELPVLIHHYYHPESGIVDVYPGPNPEIFLMIEQGVFKDELPRMSAFASTGYPVFYLDTGCQRQK